MTTHKIMAASVLAGVIWAGQASPPGAQSVAMAFVGVSVIPMDKDAVLADQTVIVRDGKIESIAPAAKAQIPAGASRIDGKGKFLMPGLAEMHAHIPGGQAPDSAVERTLFLYTASGITTIRGMLGDPRHLIYRERAARREIVSPLIYTSGPSFNAKTASTKEMAVEAVIAQKKAGYDLLKIHPGVPRDVFDAMAAKADELKIPFAGHVPAAVGIARALEAKYASIDHLDGYVEAMAKNPETPSQFFGTNLMNDIDESKLPGLVSATKAAGVWQVPTQVLMDNLLNDVPPEELAARPEMKYMPAGHDQELDRAEAEVSSDSPGRAREAARHSAPVHQGATRRRRAVRARLRRATALERPGLLRAPRAEVNCRRRAHALSGAPDRHGERWRLPQDRLHDRHNRQRETRGSAVARRQPAPEHRQHVENRRRDGERPLAVESRHRQETG